MYVYLCLCIVRYLCDETQELWNVIKTQALSIHNMQIYVHRSI